jgi:hypothetical protein
MKVWLRKPKNWYSKHQFCHDWSYRENEKLEQWKQREARLEKWVPEWPFRLINWIIRANKPKKDLIKIDYWDLWGFDCSIAQVIYPALIKIKEKKHGTPMSFFDHVPDERLHQTTDEDNKIAEQKWEDTLDQMIWSFGELVNDNFNEPNYLLKLEWKFKPVEGHPGLSELDTPKHTEDEEKLIEQWRVDTKTYHDRMQKGFELFGKHFQSLWT